MDDIYEMLGINGDSSIDEIKKAFENFDEEFKRKNLSSSAFIELYDYIHKWYEIRLNTPITIVNKEKTCDILGIEQATNEELVGLIRYITNPFINTKSDCIELHYAWAKGDEKYVRAVLMDSEKTKFTETQINAICNYCLDEPNNVRDIHHYKWLKLLENNCFVENNNKKRVEL